MQTILLVEDEVAIRDMLKFSLGRENYRILEAESGRAAERMLADERIQLILLDWMLPDTEGPALLKRLRKHPLYKEIPVIMLTARSQEADKIKGLDEGADDYITKPFSVKELQARIRALMRRRYGLSGDSTLQAGRITLDTTAHELRIDQQPVETGKAEFMLLEFFLGHQERAWSRAQLLDMVWGQNTYIEERTIDVHILRLRKILKPHGLDKLVQTVRGVGYRFSLSGEKP